MARESKSVTNRRTDSTTLRLYHGGRWTTQYCILLSVLLLITTLQAVIALYVFMAWKPLSISTLQSRPIQLLLCDCRWRSDQWPPTLCILCSLSLSCMRRFHCSSFCTATMAAMAVTSATKRSIGLYVIYMKVQIQLTTATQSQSYVADMAIGARLTRPEMDNIAIFSKISLIDAP